MVGRRFLPCTQHEVIVIILDKTVLIQWNKLNTKRYEALGYEFTAYGEWLIVNIEHLPVSIKMPINVKCDYCSKEFTKQYCDLLVQRKTIPKDACKKCVISKRKECNVQKYGVEETVLLPDVAAKRKATCIEKYGTENVLTNPDVLRIMQEKNLTKYGVRNTIELPQVQEQIRQTMLEKYGVERALQNKDILQAMFNNNMDKYGVEYISQLESAKDATKATNLERYGYEWSTQSPEINEKRVRTMSENGSISTSKQQSYIWDTLGGKLNYPVSTFSVDIAFPDEMICIEYDGGGHALGVKLGHVSVDDFQQKERKREAVIRCKKWKLIRIQSHFDKLPDVQVLRDMLEYAKTIFNQGRSWVTFDIDKSIVRYRNAIEPYNFHELVNL